MHSSSSNIWIRNLESYEIPGTKTSKCPKGNKENNAWHNHLHYIFSVFCTVLFFSVWSVYASWQNKIIITIIIIIIIIIMIMIMIMIIWRDRKRAPWI